MYDRYQSHALKTRLEIPILYGVDAVHGHNNVLGATVFPHNIGLGCTRNPRPGREGGRGHRPGGPRHRHPVDVRALVSVVRDERWGRTYEGFGEIAGAVAGTSGVAAVRGFQGTSPRDPKRVARLRQALRRRRRRPPSAPGRWRRPKAPARSGPSTAATRGSRRPTCGASTCPATSPPSRPGVGTIMVSYNSWNGVQASASKRPAHRDPEGRARLRGLPDLGLQRHRRDPRRLHRPTSRPRSTPGMDMFMVPDKYVEFYNTLKALVNEGEVPMSRIDDAVRRILRVKAAMGLLDEGANVMADRRLHASFGSAEHRTVARDAVRQSLVLLKNEGKALPLVEAAPASTSRGAAPTTSATSAAAGPSSGRARAGAVTTGGTTILQAIREAASPATKVTFSADGSGADGRRRRGGRDRRDALRRDAGRPQRPRPRSRRRGHGQGAQEAGAPRRGRARHRAADDPGSDPRRRGRHRGRVAARHRRGRAWPTCCSATTSRRASCRTRGRGRWRRSRSTSATRSTTRCSRSGSA